MTLHFYKYEGAGNDFIIIDNRNLNIALDKEKIQSLCLRHFGVGSDGLMLLESVSKHCPSIYTQSPNTANQKSENSYSQTILNAKKTDTLVHNFENLDFAMRFFNPDGSSGMMCGNGGRCIVRFAKDIGAIQGKETTFFAPDGIHSAEILANEDISLKMKDVDSWGTYPDGYWIDTGTSHFVVKSKDVKQEDILLRGRELRYDKRFLQHNGTNVNFYTEIKENNLLIRTYERGVEDETLACGTGITATALCYAIDKDFKDGIYTIDVSTLHNKLRVKFFKKENLFKNIYLTGPATRVFEGEIKI